MKTPAAIVAVLLVAANMARADDEIQIYTAQIAAIGVRCHAFHPTGCLEQRVCWFPYEYFTLRASFFPLSRSRYWKGEVKIRHAPSCDGIVDGL